MAKLVKVYTISGIEAEMYRLFFKSIDLEVMIVQESAGQAFGLTMGMLGEAHIYARAEDAEQVEEAIRKLDAGEYSLGWWSAGDEEKPQGADPDSSAEALE
jgi:hypothetical protein